MEGGGGDFGGHGGDTGHSGSELGSHIPHGHGCSGHETHNGHSHDSTHTWFAWMGGMPTGPDSSTRRSSALKRCMHSASKVFVLLTVASIVLLVILGIQNLWGD